jgi:DNA-binding PucR family transcriptional regulator
LLVEAKQDNFETGWAQCMAEMIAAQRLNQNSEQEVFGIVSNGGVWQFGKLKFNSFTKNKQSYLIDDLNRLFSTVNYVFQQCELLLDAEMPDRT